VSLASSSRAGRQPRRSLPLLDDDLPVHPRVRCADVEVCPRLGEGDGLRFPLIEWAGIPIADFALVERGREAQSWLDELGMRDPVQWVRKRKITL
jgi:hypothetical protein